MSTEQPTAIIQQTCQYIDAVQKSLAIEWHEGKPICILENIDEGSLSHMQYGLKEALAANDAALLEVAKSTAAHLQYVAFGLVPDLEECIKVGFFMGDRVVIWDYLSRLTTPSTLDEMRQVHIAAIGNALVALRSLAEEGRLVVLSHPLDWDQGARIVIKELSAHAPLTVDAVSLAATLAVAGDLRIHPYTVVHDDQMYQRLIERAEQVGAKETDYESLMLSFLTHRLITDKRFDFLSNAPLDDWVDIIFEKEEFYRALREKLGSSDNLSAEYNLDLFAKEIETYLSKRNTGVRKLSSEWALWGSSFGGIVSLISAIATGGGAAAITGGVLSLSAALAAIIGRSKDKPSTLSVFKRIKRSAEEHREAFESAAADTMDPADFGFEYLTTMPQEVSLDVAKNLDEYTAIRLFSNPGDYAYLYANTLYDLDKNIFWKQLQNAFQEGADIDGYPINYHLNDDQLKEMPIETIRAMLDYIVANDEDLLEDSSVGTIIEDLVALENRQDARMLINQWYSNLEPKSERTWIESHLTNVFGGLPDWIDND